MKVQARIKQMFNATGKGSRKLHKKAEKWNMIHGEHDRNVHQQDQKNHRTYSSWYDLQYDHEKEMITQKLKDKILITGLIPRLDGLFFSSLTGKLRNILSKQFIADRTTFDLSYSVEDILSQRITAVQKRKVTRQLNQYIPELPRGNFGELTETSDYVMSIKAEQYLRDHGYFNFIAPNLKFPGMKKYTLKNKYIRAIHNVRQIISDIEADHTDEHGFATESEFDSKGGGYAINIDLYDIDVTGQNNAPLAIIQVRMWEKRTKNGFGNVRKNYFLIGRNENGNAFAHPIPSPRRWKAEKLGDMVNRAELWIFGADNYVRCGDTALIPVKNPPKSAEPVTDEKIYLIDSHVITGNSIVKNGEYYVLDGTLAHEKGQHPAVSVSGWSRAVIGNRANTHNFANPTVD